MQYPKYLKWGVLTGLFLTLFVPFIVATGDVSPAHNLFYIFNVFFPANTFFPYITGKNFFFRIVVEIVLACYLLLALKEPKYRPRSSMLMWSVGLFVVWMGIATVFSVDPIKSFWSNFERMDGFINLLHMAVVFVVAGAVLSADALWERFFKWSIAVSAVQGVYALLQILNLFGLAPSSQSGARADTSFGNATYLAVYMLFNIFLTLFLLLRGSTSPTQKTLYGIALLLQFTALFFTETRGALLGALGGLLVVAIYIALFAKGAQWRGMRRTAIGGLAGIAVLVLAFFALKDTDWVRQTPTLGRLASISLTDKTTQARFTIWGEAWKGFGESPKTVMVGWGQENFNFVFNKYYEPSMWSQEQWFDRAHNEFLDWAIAGGLPAFLLYLSFFVLAAWGLWRSSLSVPQQGVLLGLLAGYGFNNLLVFDNLISMMYFFLLLAFIHSLAQRQVPRFMFLSRPMSDHALAVVAPLVVVIIGLGAWSLNAPGIARAQGLIAAISQSQDPKNNLNQFADLLEKPLWPGTGLGHQEVVEQLFQYSSAIAGSAASPETKFGFYQLSKEKGQALMAQRLNDARLELFLATVLRSFGDTTSALPLVQSALAHSPRKQQILSELGNVYLQAGDTAQALVQFKAAYDAAPENDTARLLYAEGLYFAGQTAASDALIVQAFGSTIADNGTLLQVYTDTKQWSRVIAIWQLRVEKSPNDAELHLRLASAYFAAGNTAAAIAELQTVAKLNPAAAAQVEQVITQIKNGTLKPQ